MDRKTAKDLLHLRDWLDRAHEIVDRGKDVYLRDDLLQEAGLGDSRPTVSLTAHTHLWSDSGAGSGPPAQNLWIRRW